MDDDLMTFSGQSPEETTLMLNDDVLDLENTTLADFTTTTAAPLLEFEYNKYKIGFLVARAVFAILLVVLTAAIRRDFFKTFLFFLLLPIIADVGFDIYTEVQSGVLAVLGANPLQFDYFMKEYPTVLRDLHLIELQNYREQLVHYTSYNIFKSLPFYSIVSFIINDFVFWSFLVSTISCFYFAHKAISQPEDINYMPTLWPFVKAQILPVLLTALDALINLFTIPAAVFIGISVILRLFTIILALIILFLFFTSFFQYCRRTDEYALGSPYALIRYAKHRLFWFQTFVLVLHTLSAPYIVWCAVSIAQDFLQLFGLGTIDGYALRLTSQGFVFHITTFFVRSFCICIFSFLLLSPIRKKLFSCCCYRSKN